VKFKQVRCVPFVSSPEEVMVQEIAYLPCILGCFRFSLRNIAVLVEVSFTFPFSIQANHRVVSEIAV